MKKRKTHPVSYVAMKSKGYVLLFLACLIFSPLSASQPWRENRFAFPLPTVARTSSGLPASPSREGHESPPCDQRGIRPWNPRRSIPRDKPRGISTDRQIQFVKIFFPNGAFVTAELAVTPDQRQLGLMFRERINSDQGMLLVFEEEDYFSIWMKNMKFPLDLLWLDQEKRIIHIECDVQPCQADPCSTYTSQIPGLYVLELQAGSVREYGLKLYDRLEFILPKTIKVDLD